MVPDPRYLQGGVKQVLIVDNNIELLESLKVGLDKYNQQFTTLYANDGEQALEILKQKPVSVVVSDVKMPKMNGLALLSVMTTQYPDIPVIIMTAYGQDELEWLARKSGAVAFIGKPFSVDEISSKILTLLHEESDGGVIKGISVGVFMQLAEMEEMTCTIRVISEASEKQGVVFFKQGNLLDARYKAYSGETAVTKILLLEQTHIHIQNSCPDPIKPKINVGLQAILLETMRQKDEGISDDTDNIDPLALETPAPIAPPSTPLERKAEFQEKTAFDTGPSPEKVLSGIQKEIGKRFLGRRVESDREWEHTVTLSLKIGDLFNSGGFRCGYIQKNDQSPNLIVPGSPSAVLEVEQACPRDRIFRIIRRTT